MYATLTRLVKTWLPLGGAFLIALGHGSHRYSWLVGLCQGLLFAWTISHISRREAQVGRTTYATWLCLLLIAFILLLSFAFWVVGK
jgi:hypothetical protein